MNYKVAGKIGILLTEAEKISDALAVNIGIDGDVVVNRNDGHSFATKSVNGSFNIPGDFLVNARYVITCGEVTFATFVVVIDDGVKKAIPYAAAQSETNRLQWLAIAGILDIVEDIKKTCNETKELVTEFSDGYKTE
ncbi:MAG: hypothetical protein MJ236_01195 [Clostridia bacterium]|nr:hypothetical protein [Clostridia bacterium]